MEPWQQWQEMAQESERAARLAEAENCFRSAASRYYYAAYQAATALLVYRGLTAPADREAWNHEVTPDLVAEQLEPLIRSRDRRNDVARRLRGLYKLRVVADYMRSEQINRQEARQSNKDCGFILSVADNILPER